MMPVVFDPRSNLIQLSLDHIYADSVGGLATISVECYRPWNIGFCPDWISFQIVDNTLRLIISQNGPTQRPGTVFVVCPGSSVQIQVDQAAAVVPPPATVSITEALVVLVESGTAQTIHIDASGDWYLEFSNQAFSASPSSGSAGTGIAVQISAGANTGDDRSGTVTARCGDASDSADLGQYGPFSVDLTELSFVSSGESKSVAVSTVGDWTSYASGVGFSCIPSGGNGNGSVEVTAEENTGSDRGGTLSIYKGVRQIVINLSQSEAPAGDCVPNDPPQTGDQICFGGYTYTYGYSENSGRTGFQFPDGQMPPMGVPIDLYYVSGGWQDGIGNPFSGISCGGCA